MKERIPGYQEISMEIHTRVFHVRHATTVFLKLLSIIKRQIDTCNKYGYVTPDGVRKAKEIRKNMNQYINIIVNEIQLAEEAFSRFMRMPEAAGKEEAQDIEAMIRRLYHEMILAPKDK